MIKYLQNSRSFPEEIRFVITIGRGEAGGFR